MKKMFLLLLFVFLSCNWNQKAEKTDNTIDSINSLQKVTDNMLVADKHKIIKIDSIGNVYIIYAKKENVYYKILSDKISENNEACNQIIIEHYYNLKLKSMFEDRTRPSFKISGVLYNEQEIEFERDSINDLHFAENIRGLCIEDI
jgi:hypothetical protein